MENEGHNVYEFGEFRVEPAGRLLLRAGEIMALRPRVYETLLYLLEHRDRVLGKDELMSAIWPDSFVEENNLTQSISELRRALGQTRAENRFIVTVPGHGYRFSADVRLISSTVRPASAALRTMAVLPFKPLVEANRDEALELGMADTLIARLCNIRTIIVRPLSSTRRFTALEQDPGVAGRELGVETVLDGSIQRWGDRIRVTARLTDVRDGSTTWAETMDEKFTDLFDVQDSIAGRVAAALTLRLSPEETRALTRRYTENSEAYELYLKGRYHWNKLTPPEVRKSLDFFARAIALDPGYALAHAGMLEAYRSLPITSDVPPREVFPFAHEAAARALEIDEGLADVHASLAFIKLWYDWDGPGALREARRAVDLNPNSSEARRALAHTLWGLGRFEDAVVEGTRARELDPLALLTNVHLGIYLFHVGRVEEARERLTRTLDIEPAFWIALLWLAKMDIAGGEFSRAIDRLAAARDASHGNSETVSLIGYALARAGDEARARELRCELERRAEDHYVPPYSLAVLHNGLGDDDAALAALERGFEDRDVRMYWLVTEPSWDRLRTNPRFKAIVRRMGFEA